jgi:hypothetical protein
MLHWLQGLLIVQHQLKQAQALHETLLLHQGLNVALVQSQMLQVLPLLLSLHYCAELNRHFGLKIAALLLYLQVARENL